MKRILRKLYYDAIYKIQNSFKNKKNEKNVMLYKFTLSTYSIQIYFVVLKLV